MEFTEKQTFFNLLKIGREQGSVQGLVFPMSPEMGDEEIGRFADGIIKQLTEAEMIEEGAVIHLGRVDVDNALVFILDSEKTNYGKLAMWRIRLNTDVYGGYAAWISDWVDRNIQHFQTCDEDNLPVCKLVGEDGNVFNIIGRVRQVLIKAKQNDKAKEFCEKAMNSNSYDEVLQLCFTYVRVV